MAVGHARDPWMMYVPIYHAQSNRAGKMRDRGDERDERRTGERPEGDLDRGNVSATGCRLASEIQNWLLRRVGDVHAARNKPAGGCRWTNGGERSTQNGKEEKKSREKRRELPRANCSTRQSRFRDLPSREFLLSCPNCKCK